jgi:osmotically-inducible protein OsmY
MRVLLGALVALTLVASAAVMADASGRSIGDKVDDAAITAKVKAKLATDHAKNLVKVNVDTLNGVVHLQGSVPTAEAKADAERLAKDTDGVVAVKNDLTVASTSGSTPAASPRSR